MNEYEQEDSQENWNNWAHAQKVNKEGPQDPKVSRKEEWKKKYAWWKTRHTHWEISAWVMFVIFVILWLTTIWLWSPKMLATAIFVTILWIINLIIVGAYHGIFE